MVVVKERQEVSRDVKTLHCRKRQDTKSQDSTLAVPLFVIVILNSGYSPLNRHQRPALGQDWIRIVFETSAFWECQEVYS